MASQSDICATDEGDGAMRDGGAHLPVGDAKVEIDNSEIPAAAYSDLLEISVQTDLEAPSMFTLKFVTWDKDNLSISWADDEIFALGGDVQISLGYSGAIATVMKGEITGLELEVTSGELPALIVRGYDLRHRLLRGTPTRSFVQMKDSDIAAQIAREHGLTPNVTDSTVTLEYVLQHGQTDLGFLQKRARDIGYELTVEDKTLYFRPLRNSQKAAISLSADRDVIEFYPRITAQRQVGQIAVQGWDPKNKQAILGKASTGDQVSMGTTSGPSQADKVFGKATLLYMDQPVSSQAEADKIARGRLSSLALDFVRGEGACYGRTDLTAGMVMDLSGFGKRFSGAYYVTSVTHTYSSKQGYRTGFAVRRNAT